MIDIVCVYNKVDTFRECVVQSISGQTVFPMVNLISINNTDGLYKSMAEAYNSHLDLLCGKYAIFLHQDIVFKDTLALQSILSHLSSLEENFVAGFAGAAFPSRATVYPINTPIRVDTVDECLFCVPVKMIKELRFNERLCNDWHMYAVELCLRASLLKIPIYAIPTHAMHLSPGYISKTYINTFLRVFAEYRSKTPYIWTTCAKHKKCSLPQIYIYIYIYIWQNTY